jgi:hypothetical protein
MCPPSNAAFGRLHAAPHARARRTWRAGAGHPLPWPVQTWLPGTAATAEDPGESVAFAHDLADSSAACAQSIHARQSVQRKGSGGELRSSDAWMATCFERSEQLLDVPRLRRIWTVIRALPGARAM